MGGGKGGSSAPPPPLSSTPEPRGAATGIDPKTIRKDGEGYTVGGVTGSSRSSVARQIAAKQASVKSKQKARTLWDDKQVPTRQER